MSQNLSDFRSIFDAALEAYKKKTGKDLTSHPLLAQLTTCNSANAVLEVLRNQIPTFDQPSNKDDKLTKWLNPTVNVLYVFSATLGEGVGLVRLKEAQHGSFRGPFQLIIISQAFSPGKAIFAGIGVLLLASLSIPLRDSILTPDSQAAKDVAASGEILIDVFERVDNFIRRLETYIDIEPTAAMTDIIVKIMVEVLSILAIATKEIEQGKASELFHGDRLSLFLADTSSESEKYLNKLVGRSDMEDALGRLDKLTQDEVRMVAAQVLKTAHGVDDRMAAVDNTVRGVESEVQVVRSDVRDVSNQVEVVDERVNTVLNSAHDILNVRWQPS
jgi:hypothetical protein